MWAWFENSVQNETPMMLRGREYKGSGEYGEINMQCE